MKSPKLFVSVGIAVALAVAGCDVGKSSSTSGLTTGGSGTTSTFSEAGIGVTVSVPLQASLSQKALRMIGIKTKGITEAVDDGVPCHAEDLAGNEIGEPCTTGADGTCTITGLTEAQMTGGYVIVAATTNGDLHTYGEQTAAVIDAAEAAGTDIAAPVNTETDASYTIIKSSCDDNLAACGDTIDMGCMKQAVESVVGEDVASTSDLGGYAEAVLATHAATILGYGEAPPAGVASPAAMMQLAIEGDPTHVTTLVGTTVEGVPVADAATNFATMVTQIKKSFCERSAAGKAAPWGDLKSEAGTAFDPMALAGIFKGFTPDEIGYMEPEDFRGYATALPDLDGGFAMMGQHEEARRAVVEQFKSGAFRDPTKAGPALGFLASTFPEPTTAGDWGTMKFTDFDPGVAARAAYTATQEYINGMGTGATFATPSEIRSIFNDTLNDPSIRQSFAVGGSAAAADFIGGYVTHGATFKTADFLATIKSTSAACTTSAECCPDSPCTNGFCTALSLRQGAECLVATDCGSDGVLSCMGAFYTGGKGHCISTTAIPTGAAIYTTAGTGPLTNGADGGYTGPAAGASGSECSTTRPCDPGISCSSTTVVDGVCLPAGFEKAPFSGCVTGSECESGTCTAGTCTLSSALVTAANTGTSTGTAAIANKLTGDPCAAAAECQTYTCQAGLCAATPTTLTAAVETVGLKTAGTACTSSGECAVGYYCGGLPLVCTIEAPTTTATTTGSAGRAVGAPCNINLDCLSGSCNFMNYTCN